MELPEMSFSSSKDLRTTRSLKTMKLSAPFTKRLSIVTIIFCSALILLNVAASAYFNPKTVVNREIDALAREYYEDYLYPSIEKELEHYEKSGTGNIYLRQLLLYDSGRRENAAGYFEYKGYTCDRNKTYVRYYPEPPYKKENYHFDVKLVCE